MSTEQHVRELVLTTARAKIVELIAARAPERLDRYADLRSQARTRVKTATGRSDNVTFTRQLLQGPIDLMQTGYAPIQHQLMREIRHQIARNPKTQIRSF